MTHTSTPKNEPEKQDGSDTAAPRQAHMGAEEGTMNPTKPATKELEELTKKQGQASTPEGDDYSVADELTPG